MSAPFVHATADVDPSARIGEGTKIWNNVWKKEPVLLIRQMQN